MNNLIKSISYNQTEIIKWILQLHVPSEKIDCDPTYSKGLFYKDIEEPIYKFDIYPQTDDTVKADSRNLPLTDNSINCIMFDPPFLATSGKSLKDDDTSHNIILQRFSYYPTEKELFQFYIDSMKEFHRILKDNGILIFKCQDKISQGTQYLSHYFIIQKAIELGYYPKDLFVLLAKNRLTADWQIKNQKHARKFHSYFIVLQKSSKTVEYV